MKSRDLLKVLSWCAFLLVFASASDAEQVSKEGSAAMMENDGLEAANTITVSTEQVNTRLLTKGGKGYYKSGKGYEADYDEYYYSKSGKGKGGGDNYDYSPDGKGKGDGDSPSGYSKSGKGYSKSGKGNKGGHYLKVSKSGKGKGGGDYYDDYGKGYSKSGKGYSDSGKGTKGGHYLRVSKSGKGKGGGDYYDDYGKGYSKSGKGYTGGYGGYSKSGKGYKGGYSPSEYSKGKGDGDDFYNSGPDDYYYSKSGKGYTGGYGGYSKSGKGYKGGNYLSKSGKGKGKNDDYHDYGKGGKGYYKSGKGYKGGYYSGKSGKSKGYGGYYGKSGKTSKYGSKNGKTSKKGAKAMVDYDNYWYDYWKENHKTYPTPSPTESHTTSPTASHTASPTEGDGIYRSDNGAVACHPFDSSGELIYSGETQKKIMGFEFEMVTNEDADDNGGIEDEVQEVENAFAEFLAGISDCKSQHLQNTHDRRLAAIGFDPAPADVVIDGGECGESCHTIGSTMSITTDSNTSDEEICQLIEDLAAFAEAYEAGTIEGVESVDIDLSTASVDGANCNEDPATLPISSIIQQEEEENDNTKGAAAIYPFVLAAAFLMLAAILFVRRKRRRREEEERRLQELNELGDFEEDDEQFAFGAGYRNGSLNVVNVHKCHSARCSSCTDSRKETEFLPLANVDKWVNQRELAAEEESPDVPVDESPPDAPEDESVDESPPPPPPQEFYDVNLNEADVESKEAERSRIIATARRVLAEDSTTMDTVHADRLDDKLRGLPTVPEDSEDSDVTPQEFQREKESGSI